MFNEILVLFWQSLINSVELLPWPGLFEKKERYLISMGLSGSGNDSFVKSYTSCTVTLVQLCTAQQRVTSVSYHVSWILKKIKQLLTKWWEDACWLLWMNVKIKFHLLWKHFIVRHFKQSKGSILASGELIKKVVMSWVVDESTETTAMSQMGIYVRHSMGYVNQRALFQMQNK